MKRLLFVLSLLISVAYGQNIHNLPTYVPIGSDARFKYDSVLWNGAVYTRRLTLFGTGTQNITNNDDASFKIIGKNMYIGDTTQLGPTFIEFGQNVGTVGTARMFQGWLGTNEWNQGYNLNYRNSIHQYDDTTQDIFYTFAGPGNGWGIQAVGHGHSNYNYTGAPVKQDVYNLYGKLIFKIVPLKSGNDFIGSQLWSGGPVYIFDQTTTDGNFTGVGRYGQFNVASANMTFSGLPNFTFADSTLLSIGTGTAGVQFTINTKGTNKSLYFINGDASTSNSNYVRFDKHITGGTPYNLGANVKTITFDYNGGVAESGAISTSTAPGNFSNLEFYWKTTNTSGTFAERMRLFQSGNFGITTSGTDRATGILQIEATTAQMAHHYDATHYTTFTTNSSGNMTIAPSGGTTNHTGIIADNGMLTGGATGRLVIHDTDSTLRQVSIGTGLALSGGTLTSTGGGAATIDKQEFTSSGTWTKPAGAVRVWVKVIGPGGGGGAGDRDATGTARTGGGGGGAGGVSEYWFDAATLPSTVTITVGTGGTGAAGQTTNTTAGANGNPGSGNSQFGGYMIANAGSGGTGGGTGTGGGAGTNGGGLTYPGTNGGAGSNTGGTGGGGINAGYIQPTGGGAGGGITTGNVVNNYGQGGSIGTYSSPSNNYGAGFVNGGAGITFVGSYIGTGGNGGNANASGTATSGGAAGNYGAGGGGGGASLNGFTSGAGGNGANGIVVVVTYF